MSGAPTPCPDVTTNTFPYACVSKDNPTKFSNTEDRRTQCHDTCAAQNMLCAAYRRTSTDPPTCTACCTTPDNMTVVDSDNKNETCYTGFITGVGATEQDEAAAMVCGKRKVLRFRRGGDGLSTVCCENPKLSTGAIIGIVVAAVVVVALVIGLSVGLTKHKAGGGNGKAGGARPPSTSTTSYSL